MAPKLRSTLIYGYLGPLSDTFFFLSSNLTVAFKPTKLYFNRLVVKADLHCQEINCSCSTYTLGRTFIFFVLELSTFFQLRGCIPQNARINKSAEIDEIGESVVA